MDIRRIELVNFRQFKKASIDFAHDPEKNITIIMGKNGVGKTTFTQAFHWCFYGITSFASKDLINYDAATRLPQGENIEVVVKITVEFGNKLYCIVRKESYEKLYNRKLRKNSKTGKDFFIRMLDGSEVLQNSDADELVEKMLPQDLAKYFFFDGEDMHLMSEILFNKQKSNDIAQVIQSIVGLRSLQQLIRHIKLTDSSRTTVVKNLNTAIDESGGDELIFLSNEIEALEEKLAKNEEKRIEINQSIQANRENDNEITAWLENHKDAVTLQKEITVIEGEVKKLQKQLDTKITETNTMLKEYRMSASLRGMYELIVSDNLYLEPEKGSSGLHTLVSKELIEGLIKQGKCICGCDLSDNQEHIQTLESWLKNSSQNGIQRDYAFFMKERSNVEKTYSGLKLALKNSEDAMDSIENNIYKNNQKIEEKRAEMSNRSQEIREKIEQQAASRTMILNLEERKEKLLESKIDAEKKLKEKEEFRKSLIEIDSANKTCRMALDMAEDIYQDVQEAYSSVEGKVRIQFKECFQNLYRKIWDGMNSDAGNRLQFEISDKYELIPSKPLDPSVGQKNSLVLSFIGTALTLAKDKNFDVKESESMLIDEIEQYPLVMDAPLSAFDTDRITNIANVIPDIAQQWIIFIKDTDGNILTQEVKNRIGKQYRLYKYGDSEAIVKEVSDNE